jgi:hypothetical protein
MLLEVIAANYVGGYKVFLTFNSGYKATVDLEHTIRNDHRAIFQRLQDLNYFKTFSIKLNTICWENEVDFAPEFLHDLAARQQQETETNDKKAA